MDVVAVFRGDWSLPRPAQLPLHGVLSEALSLAPAARLCLPQLPEGVHRSVIGEDIDLFFSVLHERVCLH